MVDLCLWDTGFPRRWRLHCGLLECPYTTHPATRCHFPEDHNINNSIYTTDLLSGNRGRTDTGNSVSTAPKQKTCSWVPTIRKRHTDAKSLLPECLISDEHIRSLTQVHCGKARSSPPPLPHPGCSWLSDCPPNPHAYYPAPCNVANTPHSIAEGTKRSMPTLLRKAGRHAGWQADERMDRNGQDKATQYSWSSVQLSSPPPPNST